MPQNKAKSDTKHIGVTAEFEVIAPADAVELLERNTHNRGINQGRVAALVEAITKGQWTVNGEAIKVSAAGELLDGQHRLWAVVESDRPITTLVIRGLAALAQETMDQGSKRSLGNILGLRGETSAHTLAAVLAQLNLFWTSSRLGWSGMASVPAQTLIALLDEHPTVRVSVPFGRSWTHHLRYEAGVAGAIHYLCASIDGTDADEFFRLVGTGEGAESDPTLAMLRRALIQDALAGPHARMALVRRAAITIRAWNAWRDGEVLTRFQWSPGGARPDKFPVPK